MVKNKRFKAVLFDFDGVLGKTMADNYQAWRYAFSQYNIEMDKNEYFVLEGLNTKKVAEHFLKNKTKDEKVINDLVALKEQYYLENNSFSFYEGVEFLISKLKENGYKLGLVSAANYLRLSKTVSSDFLDKLDVIITGDKVKKCKPDPEPYLSAAQILSLNPADCVVVENAPLGIESAKAAGMYCIAVASTLSRIHLQKADCIVEKIADLGDIL